MGRPGGVHFDPIPQSGLSFTGQEALHIVSRDGSTAPALCAQHLGARNRALFSAERQNTERDHLSQLGANAGLYAALLSN
jgi:hypothetical protein